MNEEVVKGQSCSEKGEYRKSKDGKDRDKKVKKKSKREMEGVNVLVKNSLTDAEVGKKRESSNGEVLEKAEHVKMKRRKENKKINNDMGAGIPEIVTDKPSDNRKGVDNNLSICNQGNAYSYKNEIGERNLGAVSAEDDKDAKQKKKKKAQSDKHVSEGNEIGENNLHAVSAVVDNKDAKQKKNKKAKPGKHVSEANCDKGAEDDKDAKQKKKKEKMVKSDKHHEIGERNLHAVSTKDDNKDCEQKKKKKKKKAESGKHVSEGNCGKDAAITKKDFGTTYENSTPGGTSKRVSFSDRVEVFTSSDGPIEDDNLIRGKRFSREEDEMIKKAVLNYIEAKGLGDEGLNTVLHCKSHPEHKNCWKDIGAALPWRPFKSVCYRAHILFERSEERKWTNEEYELIRSFHEKHGSEWRKLADGLGKHRIHVKDTWRRIRLPNMKKGHWSQEEYQKLFDLVNMDLRMKFFEEKKSKHGMLRDNIAWEAISNSLSTRSNVLCCQKWYTQLTSPMVAEGIWADADDYRLVDALYALDACCIEYVDWDNLLEHRSGDVCWRRWDQMLKHIGEHASKSFTEQVEVLSKRYCTNLLEARETYDSKSAVL
ncbi:hypothetical protein F2P56_004458 [Juglans regia]|uniref:Transcription termination factor 1-like n=2 Tax=Juglans regia TaxID=51240 RepID=A0A834D6B0_JUGRE|nr:transcription termination factor 1-like isoform X2 [Juglans regia]KAF5477845.1 hypothetical protein F2P56_004458 [Juglans regia]